VLHSSAFVCSIVTCLCLYVLLSMSLATWILTYRLSNQEMNCRCCDYDCYYYYLHHHRHYYHLLLLLLLKNSTCVLYICKM